MTYLRSLLDPLFTPLRGAVVIVVLSCLVACGGGSGGSEGVSNTDDALQTGDLSPLYLSLTDAEGDFLVYQVDVTSITMTRADGAVINVLPRTTTVDFAQYVEVSELLTIADAPSGRYDSVSMTLDYSGADIIVQDDDGNSLMATVVDEDGSLLTRVEMVVKFSDDGGFVLAPGIPARITLDFDLDASHDIVIDDGAAVVTAMPMLIADTLLEEAKNWRLRGLLEKVSVPADEFSLVLRPFRARVSSYGRANVTVDDQTEYEIDGKVYIGDVGIQSLQLKSPGTAVVAEGYWDSDLRGYRADRILAGSSVPWDQADILRGTVAAREGNRLEIRGAVIEFGEGEFFFNDTILLDVDDRTSVIRLRDGAVGLDKVSVGSAVQALGEANEDNIFDAEEGLLRILPTTVSGRVVSASPLALDISLLNSRRAAIYDFSGTGASENTAADPDFYEISTGTLDLNGVAIGDPARVRGYVSDFGSAPEDLAATTLFNAAEVRAHMVIGYGEEGVDNALAFLDDRSLQFNTEPALSRHHIVFAGVPIDLLTFDQAPMILPGGERGVYALWINRRVEIYTFYTRFAEALIERINGGARVRRFDAHGYYDGDNAHFTSQRMRIMLHND